MKRTFLILSFGAIIALTCITFINTGCSEEKEQDKNSDTLKTNKITNQYAILPRDIVPQSIALGDTFSWKTFIALCWPANGNTCGPDTSNGISILKGTGPVVWETYLTSDQVFVLPKKEPQKWCEFGNEKINIKSLPQKVQDIAIKTGVYRFIHRTSKAPHSLIEASGQPLVDQNGRFVRYEVRINKIEYEYIIANTLWSLAGQNKYMQNKNDSINFPAGGFISKDSVGSMEFKAAWKVLGKGDDFNRFYTIRAIIFNDDSLNPSPGENPVTLGLVGLHIAHKTATQRFWVWSTFEQLDNLTSSFNNSKCKDCKVNQPPLGPPYKELDKYGKPLHNPTQVTRVLKVDTTDSTYSGDTFVAGINKYFQNLLKGSVWANYALVSTQWELNEGIFPNFLANTVQETYLQGNNPPTPGTFTITNGEQYFQSKYYQPFNKGITSSCMGCHYTAKLHGNNKKRSDFSFLLGEVH